MYSLVVSGWIGQRRNKSSLENLIHGLFACLQPFVCRYNVMNEASCTAKLIIDVPRLKVENIGSP